VEEDKRLQVEMHRDFFDQTQSAIDQKFYLEAIFREYASIESRLEVLLGLMGAPCNKFLPNSERKKVDISHRIKCLKKAYNNSEIGKTKLDTAFFNKLDKWRNDRNIIVHGFYKNEIQYRERSAKNKKLSEDGLQLARKLYNEVKRLRRYRKNHPEVGYKKEGVCQETCKLFREESTDMLLRNIID